VLRRLLAGLVALLLAFAAVLAVPLARMLAADATRTVYGDRLADADHYATLAGQALTDGHTGDLTAELGRYTAVYGIRAWVLGVDGTVVVTSDGAPPPAQVTASRDVDLAVRGVQPLPPAPVTPGTRGDLVVAVPVGTGAEAIGALVTLSPLDRLRAEVMRRWLLLAGIEALVTAVLLAATVPLTRWLLRPVALLDAAAARMAAGLPASRVGLPAGPPELRRLAGSFDRMAAVVERTLHHQREFVGDAGHQLRTPLTSLRLSLENLGALLDGDPDDPDDPARAEHAQAMEEVRAMSRVLDGLSALTRLGVEPVTAEDVQEVVDGARPGWQVRCAAAGLHLSVRVEPGLGVAAPPGGLRHLLDELVENACRLSGGSRVAVSAGRVPTGRVEVVVRDDGRGLDAAERAAAVRRFWRAPQQQNTAGSGLGLAIVAELVGAADGTVELHDAAPGLAVVLRLASGLVGAQPGDGGGVQRHGTGGDRRPDVDAAAVGVRPEPA